MNKHTAVAAPGGMPSLRGLILTLVMQGRLVERDPNDPPIWYGPRSDDYNGLGFCFGGR